MTIEMSLDNERGRATPVGEKWCHYYNYILTTQFTTNTNRNIKSASSPSPQDPTRDHIDTVVTITGDESGSVK